MTPDDLFYDILFVVFVVLIGVAAAWRRERWGDIIDDMF